jgi:hypothetical protein
MIGSRSSLRHVAVLAVVVGAAVACGGSAHQPAASAPAAAQSAIARLQHLELTVSGGVSARVAAAWSDNYCRLLDRGTRLNCYLTMPPGDAGKYQVFLNLLHYKGPGTYPAKEEPPKGSENVTFGLSFLIRETLQNFVAADGSVVVAKADESGGAASAVAAGTIDADVEPQGSGGAVTTPVHISGSFSTALIGP